MLPQLSIITITYEDLSNLKWTLDSIDPRINGIEHIVVDGGSKDGTLEFLQSQNRSNFQWLSEEDEGLYHAMNKGLCISSGTYVIFMNSGDSFYHNETLPSILRKLVKEKPDVLYGETMMINTNFNHIGERSYVTTRSLPITLDWQSMKKGMLVCHQSFVIKRSIAPLYIHNNLSADIDWQIKGLIKSKKVVNFEGIISCYQIGGVSQQKHFRSLKDRFIVLKKHYGLISAIWSHLFFIVRAFKRNLRFPFSSFKE